MNYLTRLFKRKRKLYAFEPDYVVRPSETIKESMEYASISRSDLFNANPYIELTAFNNMMDDITPINNELATKLSSKLGSEPAFWMNLSKNYHDKKGDKMSNELMKEKLWEIEQLQTRIAELEADNANLNDWLNAWNDWLNAWKESFNLAQAEIAQLQADNRSLVEQMNQMALKPNQAVIEYFYPKHNPENRRIENLPTEECPCIVELYSGEYDIVWWIDGGFEETGWDGYCVDEVKSWACLPKGVTNEKQ